MQKCFLQYRLATQIFTQIHFSNIFIRTHFLLTAVFSSSKLSLLLLESHHFECLSLAVCFRTPIDSDVVNCDGPFPAFKYFLFSFLQFQYLMIYEFFNRECLLILQIFAPNLATGFRNTNQNVIIFFLKKKITFGVQFRIFIFNFV